MDLQKIKRGAKMVKKYDALVKKGFRSKLVVEQLADKYGLTIQSVYNYVSGRYRSCIDQHTKNTSNAGERLVG